MRRIFVIIISVLLVAPVLVQASSKIPATVQPGRLRERLIQLPRPSSTVSLEIGDIIENPVLRQSANHHIKLHRLQLIGNKGCCHHDLKHFYRKLLGKKIKVSQLQLVADAITEHYHSEGYLLTKAIVPAQDFQDGIAKIVVVQGYVDKVTIDDDVSSLHPMLLHIVETLKSPSPLVRCDLERCLLLANDLPGVEIFMELVSIPQKRGAAELILHVTTKQYHVTVGYDNDGSRWMGPQQFGVSLGLFHLLRPGDSTDFHAVISSNARELQIYHLVHETPIGCNGVRFYIAGEYAHNHPGFNLESYDLDGHASFFAFGIRGPFIRTRKCNLSGVLSFKLLNDNLVVLNENYNKDRIRMIEALGHFDYTDIWEGVNLMQLWISQGIKVLNATSGGNGMIASNASGDFTKLNAFLSRLQPLSAHFSIFLAGTGQWALNPLLLSEQFGYGGDKFGRAYNYSEIIGDSGVAAKVELRYDTRPSSLDIKNAQYFVVYDAGVVWKRYVPKEMCRQSATSVGVGLRVNYTPYFSAEVEFDRALTRKILSEELAGRNSCRYRGFFRIYLHA